MRCKIHASCCAILYFIGPHIEFIMLSVLSFYHAAGSYAIPQACYTSNSHFSMFLPYSEGDSYYW